MENNNLDFYLDTIGQGPLLSPAEERTLSERVRQGDRRALDRLVEANLRLVVSVAARCQGRGLSIDDLISEGNLGLISAAGRYDGSRGVPFAVYAQPVIRRAMERAIARESRDQRVEARGGGESRSVDAPLGAKPAVSLLSVLADGNVVLADDRMYNAAVAEAVEQSLGVLQGRERQVVYALFGLDASPITMAELASDMGLSRERVRQVRDRAVRRLRKEFRHRLREAG